MPVLYPMYRTHSSAHKHHMSGCIHCYTTCTSIHLYMHGFYSRYQWYHWRQTKVYWEAQKGPANTSMDLDVVMPLILVSIATCTAALARHRQCIVSCACVYGLVWQCKSVCVVLCHSEGVDSIWFVVDKSIVVHHYQEQVYKLYTEVYQNS